MQQWLQIGPIYESQMSKPFTLIIDQGTHATRAFAFDQNGRIHASAYTPVALNRLSTDKIEQDAAKIVNSMHQVVQIGLARGSSVADFDNDGNLDVADNTILAPLREP